MKTVIMCLFMCMTMGTVFYITVNVMNGIIYLQSSYEKVKISNVTIFVPLKLIIEVLWAHRKRTQFNMTGDKRKKKGISSIKNENKQGRTWESLGQSMQQTQTRWYLGVGFQASGVEEYISALSAVLSMFFCYGDLNKPVLPNNVNVCYISGQFVLFSLK